MATSLELELFEEQFGQVAKLSVALRWKVERDTTVPLGLFVTMHPATHPDHRYLARIRWNSDLYGPFSLQFIDPETGADNQPTAWPLCAGFSPTALAACIPITEEGHRLHPEWRGQAATKFPETDTPVTFALEHLQSIMDTTYQGRQT